MDRDTGNPLSGFLVEVLKADPASGRKIVFCDAKPGTADDVKDKGGSYGATWFPGVPRAEMAGLIRLSTGEITMAEKGAPPPKGISFFPVPVISVLNADGEHSFESVDGRHFLSSENRVQPPN